MMERVCCDYCGASESQLLFEATDTNYHRPGTFRIVRCRFCHLVYLNPRPDAQLISSYYPDADYPCFHHQTEPAAFDPRDPLVRLVVPVPGGAVRLCDVGCGDGSFLVAARRTGWEVAGVEPNTYARRRCEERLGVGVVFPSFEKASFAAEWFDLVTLWHVLEHLPSPMRALKEAHRILKPGGVLALALPNFGSLESLLWRQHWIYVMAPAHFYHFTRPTLDRYLHECGFEVALVRQEGGPPSLAANLLRSLRVAFLDPLCRRRRSSASGGCAALARPTDGDDGVEATPANVFSTADRTKERIVRRTTALVGPIAGLIDRTGFGPELKVYARKVAR